jgi:D-arginine dehydrogenase
VRTLRAEAGRITGVELASGERIDAAAVVVAAGAWSAELTRALGSQVALQPIRRHLVQLESGSAGGALDRAHPVVWRVDGTQAVYFRAESGGVLASPCDAVPVQASEHAAGTHAQEAGEQLARKLAVTAPALVSARVKRAWACLRTFAPDGELVVGADPAVQGLFWLAGLGGRGMAVAVAAGELLARAVAAEGAASDPLAGLLSPARFG